MRTRERKSDVLLVLVCVVVVLALSCNSSPHMHDPEGFTPRWTNIGTVGGLDRITDIHVTALLKAHGIDCLIEGSVIYGISVPDNDAARSIAIIKDDLRRHRYPISIWDGKEVERHSIADSEWITIQPRQKVEELIRLKSYDAATDLGAVLRYVDVYVAVRAYPYVANIKSRKREYIDMNRDSQIGHDVVIELAAQLDKEVGGKRFYFQVRDHGTQLQTQGSNGWRQ